MFGFKGVCLAVTNKLIYCGPSDLIFRLDTLSKKKETFTSNYVFICSLSLTAHTFHHFTIKSFYILKIIAMLNIFLVVVKVVSV